jgi:hypothetical protein
MSQYVVLNEDQKAMLLKDTKDLFFAAKQLHEWLEKGQLLKDMSAVLPSLIESHFVSISKALDYSSHLTKEHEERHIEIRRANQRAHDLEKQLASSKPIDGLAEQLEGLYRTVYDWWKDEGFRHISDVDFTSHGSMKVEFSFMLDTSSDVLFSDTPVTNAKNKVNKIKKLIEDGFELEKESENSRSWEVMDTPNNRRLLSVMLIKRFPSINISKIDSWAKGGKNNNEKWTIWRIEAYVHDLRDIPIKEDSHE